jgi:hypothetical protein
MSPAEYLEELKIQLEYADTVEEYEAIEQQIFDLKGSIIDIQD